MAEHVTVIIPAFNAADHLAHAVQSILCQQHSDLDIVVVDDGSSDNTADLAQRLPVRCIRQKQAGPAAARNTGINAAQGEFLAFLDADDLWAQDKLAAQFAVFRAMPNIDLVAGRVEEFYEADAPADAQRTSRQSGQRAYTIGALLARRDTFLKVGLLDTSLRFGEFIDWLSRARALGLREQVLEQVVLRRRIHRRNTTRLAQDYRQHYLATLRAHLERQRSATAKPGEAS